MGTRDGRFRIAHGEARSVDAEHCAVGPRPEYRGARPVAPLSGGAGIRAAAARTLGEAVFLRPLMGHASAGRLNQQLNAMVMRSPSPSKGFTSCNTQAGKMTSCPGAKDSCASIFPYGSCIFAFAAS